MRLTNPDRLPAPALRAILAMANRYTRGDCDYSFSSLAKPPQARVLEHLHDAEIVVSASALLYQVLGSTVHAMIADAIGTEGWTPRATDAVQYAGDPDDLSLDGWALETRLFTDHAGARLSGCPDAYDATTGTYWDWKVSTVWAYVFGKVEWGQQLAFYDWLGTRNGRPPAKARKILGVWRDWQKTRAGSADYPPAQVTIVPYVKPSLTEIERWVEERVHLQRWGDQAADLGDALPPCADEDRWRNDQRCQHYCYARPWCPQAAELLGPMPGTDTYGTASAKAQNALAHPDTTTPKEP